jgi:hypothetical protein
MKYPNKYKKVYFTINLTSVIKGELSSDSGRV